MKILACEACQKLDRFPLYSTGRSIIFTCEHELEKLKESLKNEAENRVDSSGSFSLGDTVDIIEFTSLKFGKEKK